MTIKRSGISEPISGNIKKKDIPTYCPKCNFGKLGPRIYKDSELIADRIPYDADQWKMCHHCGHLVPVYDIPQEGQLTTDIEVIDTKFRVNREEEHYEKPKHRRGFNERLQPKQDEIKDEELKKELKKGGRLLSYTET